MTPKTKEARLRFARTMLQRYPTAQNWRNVRFSDEYHFGYGPEGRVYVTRRPGEIDCPDCIREIDPPRQEYEKKVHAWAAIGYDYKSKLIRYRTENSNGKMTQQIYIEILEQEVVSWPPYAVLEEDGDSGHGPGKSNPVRAWKIKHNRLFYFNAPHSPDLSPIENAWLAPKESLRKYPHWSDETVWEVASEGWNSLSQETINAWCDSMPIRLQRVIEAEGGPTAY